MTNWDEFKGKKSDADLPPHQPLFGAFSCQTCYEDVEEATYFHIDGVLKWKCSEGHVSFAENFRLG